MRLLVRAKERIVGLERRLAVKEQLWDRLGSLQAQLREHAGLIGFILLTLALRN